MLQFIREKAQGFIAWSIVGLIALIFAFLGFDNFFAAKNNDVVAAKVNGEKIYWQTIDSIYQSLYRQYSMQPNFDPDSINPTLAKEQIRSSLVQQTALLNFALKSGYRVGKEELKQVLRTVPAFLENGKFSPELYSITIRNSGLTESGYQNNLRKEILLTKLQSAVGSTSFSTEKEQSEIIKLLNQKRDFGYAIIDKNVYKDEATVSEKDLKSFYEQNKKQFVEPEKVKISYVELNLDTVTKNINPEEDDLKQYYNENISRFIVPELVKISHILISAPNRIGDDKNDEALKKAEDILAQIKSESKSFEDFAKEVSEDKLSSVKGGDLGWVGRGELEKDFETAAFSLPKNSISKIIKTKFGYHIIKVTDRQPKRTKPFSETVADVTKAYKSELAEQILANNAEELASLAFENNDSLDEVSRALNLEIKESEPFSKKGNLTGIGSLKKVIDTAFSEDVLNLDKNSDVIKINDENYVVIRLKELMPAKQLDFSVVKAKVEKEVMAKKLENLAKSKGKELVNLIKSGDKPADASQKVGSNWSNIKNASRGYDKIDNLIVQAAFKLPKAAKEDSLRVNGVELNNGNYAVVYLKDVIDGKIEATEPADLAKSYGRHVAVTLGRYEYNLYQDSVLNNSKITLNSIPTR